MTAQQARDLSEKACVARETIDNDIELCANNGGYSTVILAALVPQQLELDLILDGFDIEPLPDVGLLRISWRK